MLNGLKTIILFIVLLSVIVIIHEFGHLCVAKLFGVYCQEFSVGMGPKIFSKKGKETEYSLRAIPLGGFVAMAGDSDNDLETKVDTTNIPPERTLPGIAPWKRICVMLAGITMNFLLAIVIMSILLLHIGSYSISPEPIIKTVTPGSPAAEAGLMGGDRIVKVSLENGMSETPDTFYEMSVFLANYDGTGKFYFEIERDGEIKNISVMPEYDAESERYLIGITSGDYQIVDVTLGNCVRFAADHLWTVSKMIITTLLALFRGIGLNNVSGPVGIYNTTAEAVARGASYYFELMALISLNVGIFNALPLPVLDGGRVVLTLIEVVIGHPVSKKIENAVMGISIALLLGLMLLATYQDVLRIFFGR